MSYNFTEKAEQALKAAQAEEQRILDEKAAKVASAEELKTKLEALQQMKAAVKVAVEEELANVEAAGKAELSKYDAKMKALLNKNAKFADEALELMKKAQDVLGKTSDKAVDTLAEGLAAVARGFKGFSKRVSSKI